MSPLALLRRFPRPRLSYANITSTAALVLALGTGTAYAANTVFSTDIVDGEVKNADLATNAVNTGKIINGGVWAQDVQVDSLTGAQVQDESLTSAELGTNSVNATEIADDSIDGGELINDSIGSTDLAAGSVGTSEVSDGSLTGADVASDGLTMSDIAGGGVSDGHVGFSAGAVPNGRCKEVTFAIGGATAGDAVVVTTKADMQDGVFIYGTQVVSSTSMKAVLCNFSGGTMAAITDMPVRIHTFH